MSAYCSQADVYRFVPPGILANPARIVSSAVAATNIFVLDGHGLTLDQELTFRAESGGSLPSPLVEGTTYYAIPVAYDTFKVAASAGGSAVDITTAGSNILVVASLPWTAWITECSAMLDQTLPAHLVPITSTVPEPVKLYCAALLAMRALAHVGAKTDAIQSQLDFWAKQTDKWARGVPIRGTNAPSRGNLSVRATTTATDPRGWTNGSPTKVL
jgi:hypothetical protein